MRAFLTKIFSDFLWEFEVVVDEHGRPEIKYRYVKENTWAYVILFVGMLGNSTVVFLFGRATELPSVPTFYDSLQLVLFYTGAFYVIILAFRSVYNMLRRQSNSLLLPCVLTTVLVFVKFVIMARNLLETGAAV